MTYSKSILTLFCIVLFTLGCESKKINNTKRKNYDLSVNNFCINLPVNYKAYYQNSDSFAGEIYDLRTKQESFVFSTGYLINYSTKRIGLVPLTNDTINAFVKSIGKVKADSIVEYIMFYYNIDDSLNLSIFGPSVRYKGFFIRSTSGIDKKSILSIFNSVRYCNEKK